MYAITGITGQVGGVTARALLAAGKDVRAVVRNRDKAQEWQRAGCEVAVAAMDDALALERAFSGAEAVFVLLPPVFDPSPGFPESRHTIAALREALASARPQRVVCLSTVGAHATEENLLTQLSIMEREFGQLPMPVAFLRAAWFMENTAWDIGPAMETGVIASYLQPLDRAIPMVATADIGRVAAQLLQQTWSGRRVVELEGPGRVSPNDLAATLDALLGRSVIAQAVPRDTWEAAFRAQGMRNPLPRMQMLDGFNAGWIDFEHQTIKGRVDLRLVLSGLIERAGGRTR
ncbi:NmrA family NAD(P)-binding protein [Paraburkholderia sp. SARCC-3016]|uniref:NmrA family NAD(P)-binding protein n=1 Tax=Paraburkholderia sp. SARCC-3016 TaxID=3058611 RepID=UPI0028071487|nr:NmrA family NAD(P)-binding protein [Paraburkholderia sp. SARCC-3016]MDQ7981978.1 NmrA family NAD(P)-binding protein [Paraburkholderia sp. SARCC-3016]